MPNDYDALAKRIRRKVYTSTEELAKDFADGLAAIARQPSVDRGLENQTIADVQGGVTLGVGDTAATQTSDYLVQNPQPGQPRNVGSGLLTRRQSRIRTDTRVLAAKVLEDAGAGSTEVSVMIVGATPVKGQDATTGIEVVADANAGLQDSISDIIGKQMMAKVTGQPIVAAGATGIQPLTAGMTVSVAVNTQHEDTTTWTRRNRKNLPTVVSVQKCETACLVNGLACTGTVCVPYLSEDHYFDKTIDPVDGDDWNYVSNIDPADEGRAWAVIEFSSDIPNGTLDRNNGDFTYYAYGVVGPGGSVTFTGVPYTTVLGLDHFYFDLNTLLYPEPNYRWALLVGCNVGQNVNFGQFTPNDADGRGKSWVVTDSNFPDPL